MIDMRAVAAIAGTWIVLSAAGCVGRTSPRRPEEETRSRLRAVAAAIQLHKDFTGAYPKDANELVKVISRLKERPGLEYLRRLDSAIQGDDGGRAICDAWGRPVVYRVVSDRHETVSPGDDYDLYSVGANGLDEKGQGDDLFVYDFLRHRAAPD